MTQVLNNAYPGVAPYIQNAMRSNPDLPIMARSWLERVAAMRGAARVRLTRMPNPGWGLALGAAAIAGAGAGYVGWRSRQLRVACAPPTELIPDGKWLTDGKLDPIAQQALVEMFPLLYQVDGIKTARELAWGAIRKLSGSEDCPEKGPRLLLGKLQTIMGIVTEMASEFIRQQERLANRAANNYRLHPIYPHPHGRGSPWQRLPTPAFSPPFLPSNSAAPISVAGRPERLARNMWGAMASCSGGSKTCGKSLDFRDPGAMATHAAGGAPGSRGSGTRLFNPNWNAAGGPR